MIHYAEFEAKTGGRLDALDVTEDVAEVVGASGITQGNVLVYSPHTTACVLVAGRDLSVMEALDWGMKLLESTDGYYEHDDMTVRTENLVEDGEEPENAPAHLVHIFAGKASEVIPVAGGHLALGNRQRVYFVELCSSRLRRYCIQVIGE